MAKDKKEKSGNWFARHKVLTVILAIIVVAILVNLGGGGKDDKAGSTGNTNNAAKDKPAATTAKIGIPARDGKFEFIVNSVKCGETTVGSNQYLQEKANGQFCRLNLTIKNIGDKAQSLFGDDQKLLDSQNRQYTYDSTATIYAAPSGTSSMWFDQINPGNTVTGDLIFDMPAGTTPATAELHDSSFSGGVKVTLQ